jgi:hypothetical protein
LPFAVLLGAVFLFHVLVTRFYGTVRCESIQALVVLLAVIFAILTLTGVGFRGTGMALTWPWSG